MGRTIDEVIAELAPPQREAIEARAQELLLRVEGLKALRILAERSQEQIAESLAGC